MGTSIDIQWRAKEQGAVNSDWDVLYCDSSVLGSGTRAQIKLAVEQSELKFPC
jgi:hypothetical protein